MEFISEHEINWRRQNLNESGVIDENVYINNRGEQFLIREKTYPVISKERLDNLIYDVDYRVRNGVVILRDGSNWTLPRV